MLVLFFFLFTELVLGQPQTIWTPVGLVREAQFGIKVVAQPTYVNSVGPYVAIHGDGNLNLFSGEKRIVSVAANDSSYFGSMLPIPPLEGFYQTSWDGKRISAFTNIIWGITGLPVIGQISVIDTSTGTTSEIVRREQQLRVEKDGRVEEWRVDHVLGPATLGKSSVFVPLCLRFGVQSQCGFIEFKAGKPAKFIAQVLQGRSLLIISVISEDEKKIYFGSTDFPELNVLELTTAKTSSAIKGTSVVGGVQIAPPYLPRQDFFGKRIYVSTPGKTYSVYPELKMISTHGDDTARLNGELAYTSKAAGSPLKNTITVGGRTFTPADLGNVALGEPSPFMCKAYAPVVSQSVVTKILDFHPIFFDSIAKSGENLTLSGCGLSEATIQSISFNGGRGEVVSVKRDQSGKDEVTVKPLVPVFKGDVRVEAMINDQLYLNKLILTTDVIPVDPKIDIAVVNSASFESKLSPNTIATLFSKDKDPRALLGTSLKVCSVESRVFGNTGTQMSFVIPKDATAPCDIALFKNGREIAKAQIKLSDISPAIYLYGEDLLPVITREDYTLVGPNSGTSEGRIVNLWGTGFGPLDENGVCITNLVYKIGGTKADVLYSGASGLGYQIALRVPWGTQPGINPLWIETGDEEIVSPEYVLWVQAPRPE